MNFDKKMFLEKLPIKDRDDWILLFSLLPLILGILAFLALMVFFEI